MPPPDLTVEFGPFRLEMAKGHLLRGQERVHLRPKAWRVLCVLATRPGEVVSQSELLDEVWQGAAVVPQVLNSAVGELRQALREGADGARYVETIPRRGYRFTPGSEASSEVAPAAASRSSRFVGRGAELEWLDARWKLATSGGGSLSFVSGPAGIGKTSLIRKFSERGLAAIEGRVLAGECIDQHGSAEPFFPLLMALGELVRQPDYQAVRARLVSHGGRWLAQVPGALSSDEIIEAMAAGGLITPGQMLREGVALFRALAESKPLLLLMEDLQWADSSTIDLLRLLAESRDPAPLMVVGTYRPAESVALGAPVLSLARRARQRADSELALGPLHPGEIRDYLSARFDGELADEMSAVAAEHSAGSPLFLRLAADFYESSGWIEHSAGKWVVAPDAALDDGQFPEDLSDLIDGQIDLLEPAELELLQVASLVGTTFSADLLAHVLGSDAAKAEKTCGKLAARGQLIERDVTPEEDSHRFRHEVHRRIVRNRVRERAPRMHRRIAEALAMRESTAGDFARIAHHFHAAEVPDRAAKYFDRAGMAALGRAAYQEAVADLRAALADMAMLPDSPERCRDECRRRLTLGYLLLVVEGYASDRALEEFEAACTVATAGKRAKDHFGSLTGAALVLFNSGRVTRAMRRADEASSLVEDVLPERRALCDAYQGFACATAGELTRARTHLESALASDQSLASGFLDLSGSTQIVLALVLAAQGRLREAARLKERAVSAAESAGTPLDRAVVFFFACGVSGMQRDAPATLVDVARLRSVTEEFGIRSFGGGADVLGAWAECHTAPTKGGVDRLRRAFDRLRADGERWGESALLSMLAELEIRRGNLREAEAEVETGLAYVRASGDGLGLVDLLSAKASIAGMRGDDAGAEESCRRACEVAEGEGATLLALRASTVLAGVLERTGRASEARRSLAAAMALVQADSDGFDMRRARDVLGRLHF